MIIDDSGDEITLEKVPGTGSKAAEAPKYFAILAVIVIVLIFIGWLARSKQKRKANQSQMPRSLAELHRSAIQHQELEYSSFPEAVPNLRKYGGRRA